MADLTMNVGFDRGSVGMNGGSVRYLVVRLRGGPGRTDRPRLPLLLALVLDRSGSMAGRPLVAALGAAARVANGLREPDRLSIVAFSEQPELVMASEVMNPDGRDAASRSLEAVTAGGCTDLAAGWLAGGELARDGGDERGRRHVVVLSDGHANRGVVHPRELAVRAGRLMGDGVSSSCVGIGDHYSTEQLEAIARNGGGGLHDAERPEEIAEVLLGELDELASTVAAGIRVTVSMPSSIRVEVLGGFPHAASAGGDEAALEVVVGSLSAGAERTVVVRMFAPEGAAGESVQAAVSMDWSDPFTDAAARHTGHASVAFDRRPQAEPLDQDAARAVVVAWQADLIARLAGLNRRRGRKLAEKKLREEVAFFERYGRRVVGSAELVQPVLDALERVHEDWGERTRKEMWLAGQKSARSTRDYRSRTPDWQRGLGGE